MFPRKERIFSDSPLLKQTSCKVPGCLPFGAMLKHKGRCDAKWRFSKVRTALQGCKRFSRCVRLEAMLIYFKRNFWGRSWWNDRFSKSKITWPLIFSRNFLELVMHGYTILNGGDLDENEIMFFCIWQYSENSPQGLAICCPDLKLVISPRCVRAEFHRSLREFCRGPVPDIRAGCNHVYFN